MSDDDLEKTVAHLLDSTRSLAQLAKDAALKLERLEEIVFKSVEVGVKQTGENIKDDAAFSALHSLVQELAEHEGISQEEFQTNYETRFRYWYQLHLQITEQNSPSLAAEIDKRAISERDIPDSFPPLFGPPPE